MGDYGITHNGQVFTPNSSTVDMTDNETRNEAIQQAELAYWAEQPERMLAYYDTRRQIVTTWPGTVLGIIVRYNVYRHNFGSRMVSLRVRGNNGAEYAGRASWDWGSCVTLRKVKP